MHSEKLPNLALRGTILVAISAIMYGLLGYFGANLLARGYSIENMLFWRFFIATCWIVLFLFSHKKIFINPATLNTTLTMGLIGVLAYSACAFFYFLASKEIGTGIAMVVFFSYPVFVFLLAWYVKKASPNKIVFFSIAIVLLGLICLKGKGNHQLTAIGVSWAILSSIGYAFYIHVSNATIDDMDARLSTFLVCLGTAVLFAVVALYQHSLTLPHHFIEWFHIIGFAIISTAIPIYLFLTGLKYISAFKASILSAFEPVITVLMGTFFLGEKISSLQYVGIFILLLGAILIQFDKERPLDC